VEGQLQTRSWDDGRGKPCYRTEIVAHDVIVLDGRRLSVTASSEADSENGPAGEDARPAFAPDA
jgi:single-strand DNA-binding protein